MPVHSSCLNRAATALIASLLLILTVASAPVFAVSASPELVEQLKQSGDLEKYVERWAQARARGVSSALPHASVVKGLEQPALSLSPEATDTFNVIVILVDFSDNPASGGTIFATPENFDTLLFRVDSADAHYSMSEFYLENSYGDFFVKGVVSGWYRIPQTYAYYVDGQNGFGGYPNNAQRLAEDAVTAADPSVDFSQFDNDGDGWCDGVFVVHAGPGAEQTGSDDMIWSHAWGMSQVLNLDGINVAAYTCEPEEYQGTGLMTMGVFAHEYGHFLGLPDLYDTDYSSSGIGDWSLMAGGSWNISGRYPAFMDPWCKKEVGFLSLTNIPTNQLDVEIPASIYNPVVYRIWENGSVGSQYFIVENRRKTGNDKGIDGSGILIYHIDETVGGNSNENHPLVAIEQADGNFDLEAGANQGDAGDLWMAPQYPEFTDLTVPGSRTYDDLKTRVAVWNISEPDSEMYANFDVSYSRANFVLTGSSFSDTLYGNGNGVLEVGESITFKFSVNNLWLAATNVTGMMSSDNVDLQFDTPSSNIGTVAGVGGSGNNFTSPIVFAIPENFDPCIDSFFLDLTTDNPLDQARFGFELHVGTPSVLVVDDDGGDNWQAAVTDALLSLRVPHDIHDKSISGSPTGELLNDYKVVIWLTGDDRPDILSASDIAAMKTFMDSSGSFFLTGQSIAGELNGDDQSFLNTYLKASYVKDRLFPIITGASGSDIGGGLLLRYDSWTNQVRPQVISPINGSSAEFTVPDGPQAISYDGTYRLVFFGFGFEGISNNFVGSGYAGQDTVMARTLAFLGYSSRTGSLNPVMEAVTLMDELSVDNVVDHTPEFSWSSSDTLGAEETQYRVQVGTGQLCFNTHDMWDSGVISGNDTGIVYAGQPLVDGMSYYGRVQVYNGIDWSDWETIMFAMNVPPSPPSVFDPVDRALLPSVTPDLVITNGSDPDGDPLIYDFEVFADSQLTVPAASGAGIAEGSPSTIWTVDTPLEEDSLYFWRARSSDGYEASSYSDLGSFYANGTNQLPAAFDLISPSDGLLDTDTLITFVWGSSSEPDPGDEVSYTLWVSEDPAFSLYDEYTGLTDTTLSPVDAFSAGNVFHWKVKGVDLIGSETWSTSTFMFVTHVESCCKGIRGNVDSDPLDEVDIGDLVFLVAYSFASGPDPLCLMEADLDGEDTVDISDVVYLVDYAFDGGPPPVPCE